MSDKIVKEEWRWYLVVDKNGNIDQSFNSIAGAEGWQDEFGGTVIKVKADES